MANICIKFVHSVLCPFGPVTIKDIQLQTHLPSEVVEILLMMRNVLNRMGKIIKKFCDFYFSSYREKCIENWDDDVTIMNDIHTSSINTCRIPIGIHDRNDVSTWL